MAEQQPQGTEYTLQGVMRFLQIEWHNHERSRNAWDIERAELKAKIAKQEGDFRNSKRLNVALDKQVRMLENALKAERAKNKIAPLDQPPSTNAASHRLLNGDVPEVKTEDAPRKDHPPGSAKFFDLEEIEEDDKRKQTLEDKDKSRNRLKDGMSKCFTELQYILTPPKNPPGQEALPPPPKQQDIDQELRMQVQPTTEQINDQRQIAYRNQQAGISQLPSMPNHHPPPIRQSAEYLNAQQQPQSQVMTRQPSQPPPDYPPPLPNHIADKRQMQEQHAPPQQQRPQQDFDLYSQGVTTHAEEIDPAEPLFGDADGGWNFDDTGLQMEPPLQAGPPPRRSDVNLFPSTDSPKSPTRPIPHTHTRRRSSGSHGSQRMRRTPSDGAHEIRDLSVTKGEPRDFKVRFALRGHLDVIRAIIFTGGGSPSEPEICTASDDGTLKRWTIPASYAGFSNQNPQHQIQQPPDLDIQSYFTHRGHAGIVTSLAACPASPSFSTGGRALGDGWVFSGGQDATIRVWERGRVDAKATLEGHTDAIWALCVLPAPASSILGSDSSSLFDGTSTPESQILLASGSADCSIRIWAVTAPPQLLTPQASSAAASARRGVGGNRRHSITSGSNFPSSPQPSTASLTPFHQTLIHTITLPGSTGVPTCITPLAPNGETFVASYTDAAALIFDSRTGEQIVGMASAETYDGSPATGVNTVVTTSAMLDDVGNMKEEGEGATGSAEDGGVEGVVITGHEDRFVRFFDANSGQCTYSMLAHPAPIAALSLSPDGHELVSAGHDANLRFWNLEKRNLIQEMPISHRLFRAEGVVCVVWSSDGRWVVSGGGDSVVKVFGR